MKHVRGKNAVTAKQFRVLAYIVWYYHRHGRPCSFREIMEALDYDSTNCVTCHLKPLKAKGLIDYSPGQCRTIVPTVRFALYNEYLPKKARK